MNAKALEAAQGCAGIKCISTSKKSVISNIDFEPVDAATVVNAYLSSVWKQYDTVDEYTWPETQLAPSGLPWFVYRRNHSEKFGFLEFKVAGSPDWSWVIAYADPADLLPKETP